MIHEKIEIQLKDSEFKANLFTYFLDNSPEIDPERKRPVVLICPGGGYQMTSDREAEALAVRFMAMGYHAAILRYSVAPARFPEALLQLATAVRAEDLMAVIEHFDGKVDFIVTDLAPRLADMTRVGVAVSDLVIIPVNTDLIEIRALRLTLELMDEAKEKIPDLNYFVMTNKFQSHNDNHQVMRQGIADQYGCPMLESSLGMRKAYPDAVGAGVTIHDISPKVVKAVDEMNTLLDEIFSKLKG